MKLEWRPQAFNDREEIWDIIAQNNPQAAFDLDALLEEKADLITAQPKLYKAGRIKGTKEAVAHPNYVLVSKYLMTPRRSCACCVHRWHGLRQPNKVLEWAGEAETD